MQTIISENHVFEVVDKVPHGYVIWNIGKYMIDGYIPLCRLKEIQPFDGGRSIETNTLKAIKCEGARTVLKAASNGDRTKEKMERYIKKYSNSKTPRVVRRVKDAKAALEAMKNIKWE